MNTIRNERPMAVYEIYMKNYKKKLSFERRPPFHGQQVSRLEPAATRGTFSTMLHETNPGEIAMKFSAEHIWCSGKIAPWEVM